MNDLSGSNPDPPHSSAWDGDANAKASSPPTDMERDYTPESYDPNNGSSHKRQKHTHEAVDRPPTPPSSASTASPASLTPSQERDKELADIDNFTRRSEEEKRILKIIVKACYAEALRSDPTRSFKKELAWAYSFKGPFHPHDLTRWYQAYGCDVLDAEFDFNEPIVGSEQESGDKGAGSGKGNLTEENVARLDPKVKERVIGSVGVEGYEEDDKVEIVSEGRRMGEMAKERLACLGALMKDGEVWPVDVNEREDGGKEVDEKAGMENPIHESGNHMREMGSISCY